MRQILTKIEKLIEEGKTRESLDYLLFLIDPKLDKYNQLVLLLSRLRELQRGNILGIISEKESNLELNKIKFSVLQIKNELIESDMSKTDQSGKITELEVSGIIDVINSNYETDLRNLEAVWDVDSVVNYNTILIIHSGHFFSELLDRVSGYLLQKKINQKGDINKLQRGIVGGDLQYNYALNFDSSFKESIVKDLTVISIGGPSINEVSAEIISNQKEIYSDKGVNIAYEKNSKRERIALWGKSAYKTSESVEKFIALTEGGLDSLLERIWEKDNAVPNN